MGDSRSGTRPTRVPSWALKLTLAVTGAVWAVFVTVHLFGNLKVFQGPDSFNHYAHWLREALYPLLPRTGVLWVLRVVLVVTLLLHVGSAIMVWWRGRRARGPHRAALRGPAAWATWSMPLTGVMILVFIVVHVLDLTLGSGIASAGFRAPTSDASFAYENLVASFQRPAAALFYAMVMVLLAMHLAAGFVTMSRDLGVMGHRLQARIICLGYVIAIAVLVGNAGIPLLVLAGVIT